MNYPPGSQPPPMSPPPGSGQNAGYPPGPPPYYAPPPKKSGAMKWILIGCGTVGVLGVLCCGGGSFLAYWGAKKAIEQAVAQVKPLVEANETVKSEIGTLKSVNPRWQANQTKGSDGKQRTQFVLDVVGEKGKGVVNVDVLDGEGDTAFFTLTFTSEGGKTTSIGTWKVNKNGSWSKVDGPPPGTDRDRQPTPENNTSP